MLFLLEHHLRGVGDPVDLIDDLLIHRRGDLRTVRPINLIPVIFLRIMRGCDHHSGNRTHLADGVAQFRRRTQIFEYEHVQSVGAEYVSGDLGELLGVVAAVVGNADADVIPGNFLKNIVGQSLRGHSDGIFVHPVGSDSHNAPEATGAKLQSLVECVLEPRRIIVPQLDHLHLGFLIEIPFQPFPGVLVVILCHNILVLLSCLVAVRPDHQTILITNLLKLFGNICLFLRQIWTVSRNS